MSHQLESGSGKAFEIDPFARLRPEQTWTGLWSSKQEEEENVWNEWGAFCEMVEEESILQHELISRIQRSGMLTHKMQLFVKLELPPPKYTSIALHALEQPFQQNPIPCLLRFDCEQSRWVLSEVEP